MVVMPEPAGSEGSSNAIASITAPAASDVVVEQGGSDRQTTDTACIEFLDVDVGISVTEVAEISSVVGADHPKLGRRDCEGCGGSIVNLVIKWGEWKRR